MGLPDQCLTRLLQFPGGSGFWERVTLFLRFLWIRNRAGASPREVWAEPGPAALVGSVHLFFWLQADCPVSLWP